MAGWSKGYDVTAGYRRVDVRDLHRRGYLNGQSWLLLGVQHGGEETRTRIELNFTPCTYGGERPWFLCPTCGRRVAILYLKQGRFGCWSCHRLNYASQRECHQDRLFRRAEAIRWRLGWPPGIANACTGKPKGMHWRTYERLVAEHAALVDAIFLHTDKWLARVRATS